MADRSILLEQACTALCEGLIERCEDLIGQFAEEMRRRPPGGVERERCGAQLDRLRRLALAAQDGIETARELLRDIVASAGALEVYDRGGRQRVETRLEGPTRRF